LEAPPGFEPGTEVLQIKREGLCGWHVLFSGICQTLVLPRVPAHARPTRNATVGRRRAPAVLLPKPQTLAADNHRIFVPHHILTSAERSTASAGCESSAWFSSCAPSSQAQCRAQVWENPMIYARTIEKSSFEARRSGEVQTFWSLPPDCAVVSAGRQAIANTSREVQM
jgi:hypothetical protein